MPGDVERERQGSHEAGDSGSPEYPVDQRRPVEHGPTGGIDVNPGIGSIHDEGAKCLLDTSTVRTYNYGRDLRSTGWEFSHTAQALGTSDPE